MISFNLDEYIKNPSRKVVTRDGHSVKIRRINFNSDRCIEAEIEDFGHSAAFFKDGKYSNIEESSQDLFFAPVAKHEGWATIYGKFLTGEIFSTKEEAEESVKRCGTKDFVAIAKVEWEE